MKNTFAFIIRIWFEARDGERKPLEYRGVIESVEDGEKFYFRTVREICAYFIKFFEKHTIRTSKFRSFWQRLKGKQ